jgi:hypothetical protein
MRTRTMSTLLTAWLIGAAAGACAPAADTEDSMASTTDHAAVLALHDNMRRLWFDHVSWTRSYVVSAVAGLPDTTAVANRLMRNQRELGNAVAEYFGTDAGNGLTALLESHIAGAVQLVSAAKAGNQPAVEAASASWYANADSIATFLSTANAANWPEADLKAAMKAHLDHTLQEATHRLEGNYEGDIGDYDAIVTQVLELADVLSRGIVAQFPERFGATTE